MKPDMVALLPLHRWRGRPRKWLPRSDRNYTLQWSNHQIGLSWIPHFGIWLSDHSLIDPKAEFGFRYLWQGKWAAVKKPKAKEVPTDTPHLAPVETNYLSPCMPLVEHCSFIRYEDGSPRAAGWWTLTTQGPAWKITVKEPTAGVSFSVVSETLDDCLAAASLMLASPDCPWQPDRFLETQKQPTKKKG